ncbi:MAG TPA: diguanylate cyclase [Candidatus Binatia bacterium]|nr:diguanylate cyclase [Candidatus Binatia bacterium]
MSLATDRDATPAQLAECLRQAERCRAQGRHREGADVARSAANIAARLGDEARQVEALRLLAVQLYRLGEYEPCAATCNQALALSASSANAAARTEVLGTLTMACNELGVHDEALRSASACLDAAREDGDDRLVAWALNRAGCAHDAMANHGVAESFLQQSLTLARRSGDAEALFSALNNLAEVSLALLQAHRRDGEAASMHAVLARGLAQAGESVDLAQASGNPHWLATALGNYGMLRGVAGEYETAFALLRRSEQLAEDGGYRPVARIAGRYAAQLLWQRSELPAAIARYRQVLERVNEVAEPALAMQLRRELSELYKQVEDWKAALAEFERFHELERRKNTQAAETRARVLTNRLELDNARLATERAQLEAELHRLRSAELEAEKRVLEARTQELDRHAHEDPLTGLWNRRHMDTLLPRLLAGAGETGRPLALAIADVDHFKQINDRCGHATGDAVLRRLADLVRQHCRPGDLIARFGGEELVIAMPDTTAAAAALSCERLRQHVEEHAWSELHDKLRVTISFGVCDTGGVANVDALLAAADTQLYRAKRNGRNRVELAAR